jgi:hypothetical protein
MDVLKTEVGVVCGVCGDLVVRVGWLVIPVPPDCGVTVEMVGESCLCGDRITGMVVPV